MKVTIDGRSNPTRLFVKGLLLVVLLALVVRLVGFLLVFANVCVQMDFAAFYIAGESVEQGLSPYVNHVEREPPIWDGIAPFTHARFLYPPLAARPFQLLAAFPYRTVKSIWMILSAIALAASMIVALRMARVEESTEKLLGLGIIAAAAYPTMALLERGQIDSFILLLILVAAALTKGVRTSLVAGALLALATLMKLNCVFLVPFLLLRRQWRAALGFVAGGLVLLGISLAWDGPAAVLDYTSNQLPRIAELGEGGTPEMALPREAFIFAMTGVPAGSTMIDGEHYRRQIFRFVLNASLAQTVVGEGVRSAASGLGLKTTPSGTAILYLVLCVALVFFWQRRYGPIGGADDPIGELLYWQLALTMILLCGPVTWAMTVVWLLPTSVILLHEIPRLRRKGEAFALLVCALGFLLAMGPDAYSNFMLSPFRRELFDQKYVVAEILCVIGLLWFWRQRSLGADEVAMTTNPTE
jgi:uncharacterized membrane protein